MGYFLNSIQKEHDELNQKEAEELAEAMEHKADQRREEDMEKVPEAAKYVGVHVNTMRNYADKGKVPVYRDHKNHRWFKVADLAELKKKRAKYVRETQDWGKREK